MAGSLWTFLFTDIEGSTALLRRVGDGTYASILGDHHEILRCAVEAHGGTVDGIDGDAVFALFASPPGAVAAALEAQLALAAHDWGGEELRVRMGLHTGEAERRDGRWVGVAIHEAARVGAAAHGGQVVLSSLVVSHVSDRLPPDATLEELGRFQLKDVPAPVALFQLRHPGLGRATRALRATEAARTNLPPPISSFVGRDAEVAAVAAAVAESRVVTLTGVGGIGKTRLALQAAAAVVTSFRDGAWLVELAGVVTPDGVEDAVASAVGFVGGPGAGGLRDHLAAKQLLLILDNCEHLLAPVAAFVEGIVRSAPGVGVLATSREGLGVTGEHLRATPSLSVPDPADPPSTIASAEAVRLFVDRAREAAADFELTDEDASAVAEVCRRLDGIPLAIELAAARVPALTPAEIAGHLDRRFKLLTAGRRGAVSRHQTLRNAIEWSYQLLDPDEQAVLDRLAVFAGGFDLAAAEAIASTDSVEPSDVFDVVARLVAKSLVVAERRGAASRYRLLETVRDFAWERVGAAGSVDEVARRHATFFATFARDAGAGLRGPQEGAWRRRIDAETDNLRAALAWAIGAGDVQLALQPIADLAVLGDTTTPYGISAADAAVVAEDHPLAAVAVAAASFAGALKGDLASAQRFADDALGRLEALDASPAGLSVRCRVQNATCLALSARDGNLAMFAQRWLADARALGDAWSLCEALTFALGFGDTDTGIAYGEEALRLARELGSPSRIAFAASMLAARVAERDPQQIGGLLDEAATAAAASGNEWVDYVTSLAAAALHAERGDRLQAAESLLAALDRGSLDDAAGITKQVIALLACLLAGEGDDDGALAASEWAARRGALISQGTAFYESVGAPALRDIRSRQSPDALERAATAVAPLGDAEMIEFVRQRLAILNARGG